MVTPRHPLLSVPLMLLIAATLCQCKTTRTVKSTRSSFTYMRHWQRTSGR
jgi:hypothetical protein